MCHRTTAWEMTSPPDRNIKIWRYMDMAKFISMLESESLWFSSAAKFDDPFEGSHSKIYVDMMNGFVQDKVERNQYIDFAKQLPKYTYINCWHMRESESYGMWKIYGKENQAIAVQTTYEKLYQSLKNNCEIILGIVNYKCYKTEQLDPTGTTELIPYFNKNIYFEDERELRAVIQRAKLLESLLLKNDGKSNECELVNGLEIKIDISKAIERVYISPASPGNYKNVVSSLLSKYGFNELAGKVNQSELDTEPLYGPTI